MALPTLKKIDPSIPWGELARKRLNALIDLIVDAGDTEPGLIEIATDAEAIAKTATDKALVPSNLAAIDASDTFAGLVELATTAEATTGTDTERAVTPAGVKAVADALEAEISPIGKHKLWIPVKQMTADAVSGPAAAAVAATEVQYDVLDFDQTTIEYAHFNWSAPSSWDEGTVTFVAVWTAASGTGNVAWAIEGVARSDDDAIAATYVNTGSRIDALITAGDLHRSAESTALTIDGTPAANDTVFFRFWRVANSGSDTLDADARLIGLELYYTTDATVDVA